MYKIKIIPVTEKQCKAGFFPKYTIMVFPEKGEAVKQTPDLIEELNMCLKNTPLALSGRELPFDCWIDDDGIKHYD